MSSVWDKQTVWGSISKGGCKGARLIQREYLLASLCSADCVAGLDYRLICADAQGGVELIGVTAFLPGCHGDCPVVTATIRRSTSLAGHVHGVAVTTCRVDMARQDSVGSVLSKGASMP